VIPAARVDRALLALAALAALAYLALQAVAPYPGETILKTSMCVLLAALAGRHRKWLLCVALTFSALGDALLSIDGTALFVPALGSFLVTHLFYSAIFVGAAQVQFTRMRRWRLLLCALVTTFALTFAAVLWPQLGALAIPVAVYMLAIVAMTMLALRVPVAWVPIGAVLFLASDSLIAFAKFIEPAAWQGPAIWLTYAAAQLLIVYGLLGPSRVTPSRPELRPYS
jgi:uncharacterized membrane protein YhhN